jgi:hypothetical protein
MDGGMISLIGDDPLIVDLLLKKSQLISPQGTLRCTRAMAIWEKQKLKPLPKKGESLANGC